MYESQAPNQTKVIKYVLLGIVTALIVWGIWYTLTHGMVKLTANDTSATLSIANRTDTTKMVAEKKGGSLQKVLRTGTYVVTAKNGQKQTSTEITVSPFSVVEKTLALQPIQNTEPVSNIETNSFAVSSGALTMLDTESNKVSMLDGASTYAFSDDTHSVESTVWVSAQKGYGVGTSFTSGKRVLFEINNTSLAEISSPQPITKDTYLAFNVDASGSLFVLQDGVLYRRSGVTYTRLTETDKKNYILSANNTFVTMFSQPSSEQCKIQVYNYTDKTSRELSTDCSESPDLVTSAAWSPDNSYLLVSAAGRVSVYDKNLALVYRVPDSTASAGQWESESAIIYSSQNNLWRYDIKSKTSTVIAATPDYVTIVNIQKAGETYYFAGRAGGFTTLYRTTNNAPSVDTQKLAESNMHVLSDTCRIRYTAFTSLKIIAATSENQKADCETSIKSYLAMISVAPTTPIHFILSPEASYIN